MPRLFTIGHSTRTIGEFISLLQTQEIEELVDVRTMPRSRYTPQFNADVLGNSLAEAGIRYMHLSKLGGLRKTKPDSKNMGWRNASFRGYADYMGTEPFAEGLAELEAIGKERRTAIMCAEAVPWRCHRSLIADALIVRGWDVLDIMDEKHAPLHKPTPFLKVQDGEISYPKPE